MQGDAFGPRTSDRLADLAAFYYNDFAVQTCRRVLLDRILSRAPHVGGRELPEAWSLFVRSAFDLLTIRGYVAYRIERHEREGVAHFYPKVEPEPVGFTTDAFGSVVVASRGRGRKRLFAIVLDVPSDNGTCRTPFAALYQEYQLVSNIRLNFLHAEEEKKSPLVFLERREAQARTGALLGEENLDLMMNELHSTAKLDSVHASERLELQAELTEMLNRNRGAGAKGEQDERRSVKLQRDPYTSATILQPKMAGNSFQPRLFPVPTGFGISGQPYVPSNSRGDYIQIKRQLTNDVCCAMGVPVSLLITTTGTTRSAMADEAQNASLTQTVRTWKTLFERHLSLIYSFSTGTETRVQLA